MLTKCVNCEFYVKRNDKFCYNCGIKFPFKEFTQVSPNTLKIKRFVSSFSLKIILSVLFTTFILFAATDFDVSGIAYLRDWILVFIFIIGIAVPLLSLYLIDKWCDRRIYPMRTKTPFNLSSRSKLIEERLSDLHKRVRTIDSVLSQINENSGDELRATVPKLLSAREMVTSQFARYELQKQKIELVRLQNSVSPYLFSLHRLNAHETDHGLAAIETTKREIDQIRRSLTSYAAIEFPAQTAAEKENFLTQLNETDASCEHLREALLSKQAARALQGIAPIEENLKLPGMKDLAHSAETFNLQATLTDFTESFDELEREYQRVRAESETSKKLLEV